MEENFQKYEANVTHVRNLFSPEDISIRREADLTRVPRGHRVAHDESIGSANVSICLTNVQPAISPRHLFFSLFFIPNPKAIFPSGNIETPSCVIASPIEKRWKVTISDPFENLNELANNLSLQFSISRIRWQGENLPELNLICPPSSIRIDRSNRVSRRVSTCWWIDLNGKW